MKKLFETYASVIAEELLDEKRVEFNELEDNIVVVEYTEGGSLTMLDISNYNPDVAFNGIVKGYIQLSEEEGHCQAVDRVAAEKGYGLLLYELAMQMVYPDDLVSSRDGNTKDGAFRLYQYYYNNLNPKVHVTKISEDDAIYMPCIDVKEATKSLNCPNPNPEILQLYNSRLSMKPDEINLLLRKGKKFMEDNNLSARNIAIEGLGFFRNNYKVS